MVFMISGFGIVVAQDTIPATEPETPAETKKPLEKTAFESGIALDNQTVYIPPSKTLEFVLQHRFGTIQNGIEDLLGIWGASNIRMGLNFSITNNFQIGLGTTKNNRLQDLSWKYTFLRQRKDGGFPVTLSYYGNLAMNLTNKETYGMDYKFIDRLSWYHELMVARKFCKMFSLQLGFSYTHYNKVDTSMLNDVFSISAVGRVKISPQSSILLSYQQPFLLNYDPAFVVRYPDNFLATPTAAPYANVSLGWEIATSTHAFHIFLTAAPGIVPQEIAAYNPNNFWNGYILFGFNMTRLWGF
jgi:hypothetical protein